MGRKRTPGLRLRVGIWHIEKVIQGRQLNQSTGTSDLEEAERFLARRIEEIRQATVYGVRPRRTFANAARKYLKENMDNRSIGDDASRLKGLLPCIGDIYLDQLHDGTLAPYVEALQQAGRKAKTINNGLELVRRILNLAARSWRDDAGMTWLEAPPLIRMLKTTDSRRPYPISWEEQKTLLRELPAHLTNMMLFKVNTGTREQEVCQLRWDWEIPVPELDTSVFMIPGDIVKNEEDRLVVLNRVARSVIETQRGKHKTRVFTYRPGPKAALRPVDNMRSTAWKSARVRAAAKLADETGEPAPWGFEHLRVHDLKHTFGRRLRAAGHKNGDITSHYSAPEIRELLDAANKVCESQTGKIPALTILKRKAG